MRFDMKVWIDANTGDVHTATGVSGNGIHDRLSGNPNSNAYKPTVWLRYVEMLEKNGYTIPPKAAQQRIDLTEDGLAS